MRWIRILDKEEKYAASLGAYLESHLPDCRILIGEPTPMTPEDRADTGNGVVVAGYGYRNWSPGDSEVPVLRLAPWPCQEYPGISAATANSEGPARLGNARDIADAIEQLVPTIPNREASGWIRPRTASRIVAVITDACDRARKTYIEEICSASMESGGRAVYLPFLPAHRMACYPMSPAGGPTLTQLLLNSMEEDTVDNSLGPYLHPARSGVLCIQPAESHEHLLQCHADCIRHVMGMLSRWMAIQPAHSVAVTDIAELPEDTMAAILAICGDLYLYSPHGDDGQPGFSERISPLAARLPSSCRVTRIRKPLPCRLSHGQPDPTD